MDSSRKLSVRSTTLINCLILLYTISILILTYSDVYFRVSNYIALVLIAALALFAIRNRKLRLGSFGQMLLAFLGICYVSLLWAKLPEATITKCITLTEIYLLTLLIYSYIQYTNGEEAFLTILTIAGLVFVLYTILYYGPVNYFVGIMNGRRMGEDFQNANQVGITAGTVGLLFVWNFLYRDKRWMLVPFILAMIEVFGSASRTALLAALGGIIVLYVLKGNYLKRIKSLVQLGIILVVVYLILQLPVFESLLRRFELIGLALSGKADATGGTAIRIYLIQAGLRQFYETPFTGVGIGGSGYITNLYWGGRNSYLHNNYAELLASVGLFGTISYYIMYLYPVIKSAKHVKKQNGKAILVIAITVFSLLTQFGTVDYSVKFTYMLFILTFALVDTLEKGKKSDVEENN